MSRKLKRVPMDFSWPKDKVWKGYINPYAKLMKDCPGCSFDKHGPRGYSPEGFRYHQEWYGYVEFDPVAYGAKPIPITHPRIREHATRSVNRDPDFFMSGAEKRRERENLQKAGVDLIELMMTDEELKAKLNAPAGDVEELQQPGLVKLDNHRGPAIEREIERLHRVCIQNHWMHHLIQADVDALVKEGRLMDFTRRPRNQEQVEKLKAQEAAGGSGYWLDEPNGYHPTADEINDWALFGMGHDSINSWVCMKARAEREGVELTCKTCGGQGYYWPNVEYDDLPRLTEGLLKPAQILELKPVGKLVPSDVVAKLYEEWEDYEPPEGPGFQLWENCSEGSPVSPVFATIEELCEHCETYQTTFGSFKATKEEWRKMLDENYVYAETTMPNGDRAIFI